MKSSENVGSLRSVANIAFRVIDVIKALLQRPRGSNPDCLTIQTSLAKKLPGVQHADDGFFALLGNNGQLDAARLDVKNPVSLFALGVDDPAFTVLRYRFSGPDLG